MQSPGGARWRSWLLAFISGFGVLAALGGSGLLLFSGLLGLAGSQTPLSQSIPTLNLAWSSGLVALLCIPSLIYSIRELRGSKDIDRPNRRNFILACLAMLVWVGMVFLFKPVEASQISWLILPPLVILATIIPLWWYLESGRRRLSIGSPARIWGSISFSLVITVPILLVVEILLLVGILLIFGFYAASQPELAQQMENYARLFSSFSTNPAVIEDLFGQLLQKPAVVVGTLAVAAGIIPLLEELLKPLAVWLLAGDRLTPPQGFVAGIFCGASIALYENLTALSAAGAGGGTEILLGRVGTGLLHVLTAGLTGWGLASFWQNRRYFGRLIGAYILAVFLHSLWNAAGVISGIAPLIPMPGGAPALIAELGEAAKITLFVLIGVNLILLFLINLRLRKEDLASTGLPGTGLSPTELVQSGEHSVDQYPDSGEML